MNASFRFLALPTALALAVIACSTSVDLGLPKFIRAEDVGTAVAQTLQALTQQAIPTNTPTATPTSTPTNIPMPALLSVSSATDCFAGPSSRYGFVITIRPGTMVTVVGQDPLDNYWIIDVPGYPGTVCWLSGQYAQITGDAAALPAPATPLASRYTLSEPRNLRASCDSEDISDDDDDDDWWHDASELTVDLRWVNTEPNQTAVRIYRNGWQIATLRGRASSFTDIFIYRGHHHEITYGVQAVNGLDVSSIVTIEVRRCE